MGETCATCRFSVIRHREGDKFTDADEWGGEYQSTYAFTLTHCRRKPPVFAEGNSYWPSVDLNDWCGEYSAALNESPQP